MAGFGPAREGVKVPCLTAWLHPCIFSHRLPALRSVWIAYTISRTEPGKHTALHNGLAKRQPLPHHFRIPFDEHASEFALHGSVRANHGTFQPCAGMSVASVSSFIGRSQPNNYSSTCRFHTAHRQAPCSGLTLPRRRNAVAYIWQGRLGIEPTQAVLETASPALEHSPLYPAFAYPPERVRVLSNARFNAGKSNGPSRSHALLTGHNARQVRACRNIAPVRCQLWDLAQTAGLEPAHTSLRDALPTELRLRMSPLGHFVREPWTRGARGPMPNRNCTGASMASTSCRRRAAFAGRSLYFTNRGRGVSPRNAPCHGADGGACTCFIAMASPKRRSFG